MDRARFLRLFFGPPLSFLLWRCRARPTTKVTLAGGLLGGDWSAISEGLVTCFRHESEFQKQLVLIGAGNRLPAEFGTSKDAESIRFLHDKRLTLFNTRREHEWKIYFGAMALLCAADAVLLSGSLPPP